MRNMSFMLTTEQFLDGSKDVTRRFGWGNLRVGQRVQAVRKSQGLKKGETVEALGVIEIVDVRPERLDSITQADVVREGFPGMTPDDFVSMFCKHMKCVPGAFVNRIEFKRVDDDGKETDRP